MRIARSIASMAAVFLATTLMADARPLSNRDILVLFNKANPESARLAEAYQDARGIPPSQLLGLDMPRKADITRNQYFLQAQNQDNHAAAQQRP